MGQTCKTVVQRMHVHRLLTAPRAVFLLSSLSLGALALACGPSAAPAATPTVADPFAVVRATSQAAYQSGKEALDRGDLLRGCPAIDTAKTTDPDNRTDIQSALDQCLTQIPQLLATSAAASAPSPVQRTIVVPTAPAAATAAQPTPAAAANPANAAASPRPATAAPGAPSAPAPASPVTTRAAAPAALNTVTFRDPQGRFTVAAPADWTTVDPPQPAFAIGTAVVQFRDPTGRAELDVAVDTSTRAVSPELYAASLELSMQQQVPGYATEQASPTTVSGSPAIRRVFTFTQQDATGRELQARAVQTVVVKGQTPYVVTASAPADQFQQYSPIFDQVVESFRFS
jgi:hypothetical protein